MILTRWHQDDPAGRILPEDWDGESGWFDGRDGRRWYAICLPAIADRADDPLGRPIGATLWPEWFNLDHWKPFQRNSRTWTSLYQQKPAPAEGTFFQGHWFKRFATAPVNLRYYMTSDHAPMPSRDANGRAMPAQLKFYLPTSGGVPATVFQDSALTVPHTFPITSDAAGRWPQIWAEENTYFDVAWLSLATGAQIATFKDVRPLDDALAAGAVLADAAAEQAQAAADAAEQTYANTQAAVAELGDFSEAAATAAAAAVTAVAAKDDAEAAAVAAGVAAGLIDTNQLRGVALGYAITAGALL